MLSGAPLVPPCEFENLFHSLLAPRLQLLCCFYSAALLYHQRSPILLQYLCTLSEPAELTSLSTFELYIAPLAQPFLTTFLYPMLRDMHQVTVKICLSYYQVGSLPISLYFTPLESALKSIKSVSKSSPFTQFIFYIFKTY